MGVVQQPQRWIVAGLAALLLLAVGASSAQASCVTWNGSGGDGNWFTATNWSSNQVPGSGTDVCIDAATVSVTGSNTAAAAKSLTLSDGATLNIEGATNSTQGVLTLASGGTIDSTSSVVLTDLCSGAGCTADGSVLTISPGGALANAGTITFDPGQTADSGRDLDGDITNTGTINVNAPANYDSNQSGGKLDNQGVLSLDADLTVTGLQSSSVTNDTGGSITNNGGTRSLAVDVGNTFKQGAGTTSPSTADPAHPAVLLDDGNLSSPATTLHYTGTGASTIEIPTGAEVEGNLAAGQNLVVRGSGSGCQEALATAPASFSNAGTITLTGSACSGLALTSGTLTNTGTIVADSTTKNITREISGSLANSGTLNIDGATAFDQSGATLKQTAGTTALAHGAIFDTSASGATFQLQGGTLTGGGPTQSSEAVVNGPVNNTGANIVPGSASTPGLMTVGPYTQGPGGRLTIPVQGAGGPSGVGTHYSELASTSNMTLGGTLAIDTVAAPSVNDLDTIAGANGTVSGTFATLVGSFSPGSTFGYKAIYGSNYAALEVGAALQVKKSGPGTGTVTSSPSGINCGSQCDRPFFQKQTVTLTAHPASGSAFGGWSGGCTGSGITCQVKMTQARTVTARFVHATTTTLSSSLNPARVGRKVTYTASVSPDPTGGTVKFTAGGSTIPGCGTVAVNASTGKATCSVRYSSTGSHKIQAAYSGNASYGRSASSVLTEQVKS